MARVLQGKLIPFTADPKDRQIGIDNTAGLLEFQGTCMTLFPDGHGSAVAADFLF